MLVTRLALLLPLLLAGEAALAQTRDRPVTRPAAKAASAEATQDIQKRVAEWLKTCLEDWDRTTHMTKSEWRTTCQRVAADRGRFLIEHPTMNPFETKSRLR